MSAPSIALAIPWCPWIPERVQSLQNLKKDLGVHDDGTFSVRALNNGLEHYREFTDRLPNDQWSEHMFHWLAETGADWTMQIQEDALVPGQFWSIVGAILDATPKTIDIIGLHVCSPFAEHLVKEGVKLFTSADALVGVLWAVRGPAMKEFCEWRATKLHEGWRTPTPPNGLPSITEDTMMALWAMTTGRKILHTAPAIVDHDTSMVSVHGNDDHENRRPMVPWNHAQYYNKNPGWTLDHLKNAAWWASGSIPHIGRFYSATPHLARRWVKEFTDADYQRAQADDGRPVKEGMRLRMLARSYREPLYRLLLGTPHMGSVHPEYAMSLLRLSRTLGIDIMNESSLEPRFEGQDLVRVRSRMVRIAYDVEATHLLFVDSDCSFEPEVVMRMLRTGKDFVQAPYLRRDGTGYTIRPTSRTREAGVPLPEDVQPDGTWEIEGTGLGLTLISRECMAQMLTHYSGTGLDYLDLDRQTGQMTLTVALFQLLIRDLALMGEDASFAQRWRDIGGKVWLYVGQGSPVAHHGEAKYQGAIEDLGFTRSKAAAA